MAGKASKDLRPRFKLTKTFVAADAPEEGIIAYEFSFRTPGGRKAAILTLPQIDSTAELRGILGTRGFSASAAGTSYGEVQAVLNGLATSERARRLRPWRIASAGGWHAGGFLLQGLSVLPGARLVLDPRVKTDALAGPVRAGSFKTWFACMKRLRHSSAVVAAVCAALSACLLPFRRGASAAGYLIVFTAATSVGKTFASRAAKTVIGHPLRLRPFRASEAGLEWIAQAYRHLSLVIDEPRSTRSGHRDVLLHIAHLVEGGAPPILDPRFQRDPSWVETVLITGAEEGALGERSGGEKVRLLEIPCGPMGPFGIIDQHEQAGVADDAAAKQLLDDALAILVENHGHALPMLAEHVAALGADETTDFVVRRMAEFMAYAAEQLGPTNKAGLRARSTFAFFFAAGALASTAKVVPWTERRIRNSLLRCLRWHEQRTSAAAPGREAATAARRLAAALTRCADTPSPASKKALVKRGAVYDFKAKEVRVTDGFLRKEGGSKRSLKLGMEELERLGLLLPGDAPGKWLRQVRYADGRIRVACFKPEVLGHAGTDRSGGGTPLRAEEGRKTGPAPDGSGTPGRERGRHAKDD